MMARTASINGVTRQREFEIDLKSFERVGCRMRASAEASTLGLKPGEWPDWFIVPVLGTFILREIDKDGTHIYSANDNWFTIFND
jgi:hypothetical protein